MTAVDPLPAPAWSSARLTGLVATGAVLGVGILAFGLARAALLADVGLWDTAEYQTVPPLLGTLHPTGFPAYVVLGWVASAVLAPLGSTAFRMDLLSAILVGVAVTGTAWLVVELTGRLSLAVGAAIGLALTPIVWQIGTRADAHALHLALLPYLLIALVAWDRRRRAGGTGADRLLLVAAALYGVALADHRLVVFLAPGIAAFVLVVEPRILRRRRLLAACAALAFGVAATLYLELPLRAGPLRAAIVYGHPDTFIGFWYVVLGVQFGGVLQGPLADLPEKAAALVAFGLEQLGPLFVAVPAAILIAVAHRPRYALLTVPAAALTWFFAAGYTDADIGRYYLGPALFAWTWLAIAAGWLLDLLAVKRGWGQPIEAAVEGSEIASTGAPHAVRGNRGAARRADDAIPAAGGPGTGRADDAIPAAGGPGSGRANEPDARPAPGPGPSRRRGAGLLATAVVVAVLVVPAVPELSARWASVEAASRDANARTWLDAALATMQPNAVVVSWWSYSTPLWYAQLIEGRRLDVSVLDDRTRLDEGLGDPFSVIDSYLGRRPVYAIRVDPGEIARLVRRYDVTSLPMPDGPALVRIDGLRDPSA